MGVGNEGVRVRRRRLENGRRSNERSSSVELAVGGKGGKVGVQFSPLFPWFYSYSVRKPKRVELRKQRRRSRHPSFSLPRALRPSLFESSPDPQFFFVVLSPKKCPFFPLQFPNGERPRRLQPPPDVRRRRTRSSGGGEVRKDFSTEHRQVL